MSDITTPIGTVCFPNLTRSRLNDLSGKEEFSVMLVFEPGTDLSELKEACVAAMEAKFGADRSKWPRQYKSPLRPCEDYAVEGNDGTLVYKAGMMAGGTFVNLKNERQPGLVNPDGTICTKADAVYSGCKGRALVRAFGYDQKGNKGVSLSLQHFQKTGDGERIDGRIPVERAFAPVTPPKKGGAAAGSDLF